MISEEISIPNVLEATPGAFDEVTLLYAFLRESGFGAEEAFVEALPSRNPVTGVQGLQVPIGDGRRSSLHRSQEGRWTEQNLRASLEGAWREYRKADGWESTWPTLFERRWVRADSARSASRLKLSEKFPPLPPGAPPLLHLTGEALGFDGPDRHRADLCLAFGAALAEQLTVELGKPLPEECGIVVAVGGFFAAAPIVAASWGIEVVNAETIWKVRAVAHHCGYPFDDLLSFLNQDDAVSLLSRLATWMRDSLSLRAMALPDEVLIQLPIRLAAAAQFVGLMAESMGVSHKVDQEESIRRDTKLARLLVDEAVGRVRSRRRTMLGVVGAIAGSERLVARHSVALKEGDVQFAAILAGVAVQEIRVAEKDEDPETSDKVVAALNRPRPHAERTWSDAILNAYVGD